VTDLARFLEDLGLSEYRQSFLENEIGYDLLSSLTDADLRELGVKALGHRKRILQAAARLPDHGEAAKAAEGRAQRRQLTLMFADLVDSTELAARMDLEAYRETIRGYQAAAAAAIETQGGYVAKYSGDGVLAYFGYPRSHEDDAARAIRAGRDLVERVARIKVHGGIRLGVRIGIETGPVVVGEIIGQGSAQEHTVVGSTPNLAARLQAAAEPDTIAVGPVAHRLAVGAATFRALGERQFKGFEEPISIWQAVSISEAADRLELGDAKAASPLVGRGRELGQLASAFARMRAGEAPVVHVVGEAGIGKSRLVREFLVQARDVASVLTGYCASHGTSTAFYPFVNLLRGWFADAGGDPADGGAWTSRLVECGLDERRHVPYLLKLLEIPHVSSGEIDAGLFGVRTQEAMIRFVAGHASVRPTVLYINDLHWVDERSATLLDALVRSTDREGVLVLTTSRRSYVPDWRAVNDFEEIRLTPLSAGESLRLFRNRIASEMAEEEVARVVERAGGNPLFLEELARHFARAVGKVGEESGRSIPETLAGLLMQRIDALSPAARSVAATAAVAGRRFDTALLGDGTDGSLAELGAAGIVLPDGATGRTYRFHHALVHDAIYDSLLAADRRRLHAEVGARLARQFAGRETEAAEDLARHFEAAGDIDEAVRCTYLAGTKALNLFALKDAETWYGKCLSLIPPEASAENDLIFARSVVNQTQVLCWNGDFPAMVSLAATHLPRIQALGAFEEVSRALTWIGEGYMHAGRYDEARATLLQALETGRSLASESCIAYASGELMWLDTIVGERDSYAGLTARADALEATAEILEDPYITTLACYTRWVRATQAGRIGSALEAARKLRTFGEQGRYPPAVCWGACLEAEGEARAGNAAEAKRIAAEASAAAACGFDRLMADLVTGVVLLRSGDVSAGLALLERAPWRTERIGAFYLAYAGDVAFGRALAEAGRLEEARRWLRDGMAWFRRMGNRRAECMAALELARTLTADSRDPQRLGRLGSAVGRFFSRSGDWRTEASRCVEHCIAAGGALEMHELRAEALMMHARIADPDSPGIEEALTEAHDIAARLEWLPLKQRVNAEMRRLGVSPRRNPDDG